MSTDIEVRQQQPFFFIENAVWDACCEQISPTALKVYCCLGRMSLQRETHPKQSTIAKRCGFSDRTVRTALSELTKLGLIDVTAAPWNGSHRQGPNIYTLRSGEQVQEHLGWKQASGLGGSTLPPEGGSTLPREEEVSLQQECTEEERIPPPPSGDPPKGSIIAGNGLSEEANAERKLDFQVAGTLPQDVPILEMVDVYHSIVTAGARVQVLNQKRIGQLRARWKDLGRSIQAWAAFCHRVQASPFLTGQVASHGKEPFAALDIGWITGSENYVKITEGRYDGGKRETRNNEVFDDFVARHT